MTQAIPTSLFLDWLFLAVLSPLLHHVILNVFVDQGYQTRISHIVAGQKGPHIPEKSVYRTDSEPSTWLEATLNSLSWRGTVWILGMGGVDIWWPEVKDCWIDHNTFPLPPGLPPRHTNISNIPWKLKWTWDWVLASEKWGEATGTTSVIKRIDKKQTCLSSPRPHLLPEYRSFHRPSRGQSLRLERPWVLELEGHLPRKMPALDGNLSKK